MLQNVEKPKTLHLFWHNKKDNYVTDVILLTSKLKPFCSYCQTSNYVLLQLIDATSEDIESQGDIGIPSSGIDPYTPGQHVARQRVRQQVFAFVCVTWKLLKRNVVYDLHVNIIVTPSEKLGDINGVLIWLVSKLPYFSSVRKPLQEVVAIYRSNYCQLSIYQVRYLT